MMRTWRRGTGGPWPTLRRSRCRLRHLVRRLAGRHGHPVGYRNHHVVRSRQAGKAEAHPRGPDMAWPTGPALAEHACSALERASTRPLVSRAGFDQLLAVGFGVVVAHAAAESPDTSGNVAHGVGYATCSEQEQNDGEHDQPVSEAQRPHDSGSRRGRYVRRTARLSCVDGSCAGGRSRRRPTGKAGRMDGAIALELDRVPHRRRGLSARCARASTGTFTRVPSPRRDLMPPDRGAGRQRRRMVLATRSVKGDERLAPQARR